MKLHFITNHESCFLTAMFSLCSKYILHLITCSAASLDWPPQSFFFFFWKTAVVLVFSFAPPIPHPQNAYVPHDRISQLVSLSC